MASGGELGAALATTSVQDGATGARPHAQTEAVGLGPATVVGLEGALAHERISFRRWVREDPGVWWVTCIGRPRPAMSADSAERAVSPSRTTTCEGWVTGRRKRPIQQAPPRYASGPDRVKPTRISPREPTNRLGSHARTRRDPTTRRVHPEGRAWWSTKAVLRLASLPGQGLASGLPSVDPRSYPQTVDNFVDVTESHGWPEVVV